METNFEKDSEKYREAEIFRRLAFIGILTSTIAALTCVIAVPALYGYLQKVQSGLELEAEYCKSMTGTMWQQFAKTQQHKGVFKRMKAETGMEAFLVGTVFAEPSTDRAKRQSGYDTYEANRSFQMQSSGGVTFDAAPPCSCNVGPQGPAGPPGPPGDSGLDGRPGKNGKNGIDAAPGDLPRAEDFCFDCPAGPPGPSGAQGPKGPKGARGPNGKARKPGDPGQRGPQGPMGSPGVLGPPGQQGAPGKAGVLVEVDVPHGPAGPPGLQGPKGLPGPNGENGKTGPPGPQGQEGIKGKPGPSGKPGLDGSQGMAGEQGLKGFCDHCPIPRTAPGY